MQKLAAFALLATTVLAGCTGRDSKTTDSTLASDLALASQMQRPQPQLTDTATGPTPDPRGQQRAPARIDNPPRTRVVARTPVATQAAAPARTIGAGAQLALASQQRICTSTNRAGDRFVATLTSPVIGTNGAVIPSGSSVILEIASVTPGTNSGNAAVSLIVHSIEFNGMSYPLSGDVYTQSDLERTRVTTDANGDKKKVLGGAIAGAIIGQIIGKSTKGTVIGAAAGAATGAVVAKAGEKFEACLPVGGAIRLTLSQAVVL